jgi:hypothetical protein
MLGFGIDDGLTQQKKKRKQYTADFKAKVVKEMLRKRRP